MPEVRTVTPFERDRAVDTIVLAFAADPIARWCWPDSRQYLTSMPRFIFALGGCAFSCSTAFCIDDVSGAALWLPPGVHPDEAVLGEIVDATVPASVRRDLLVMLEEMAGHHPEEPHWYLPFLGVDPARQAQGNGDALMTRALAQCDRDGRAAYLESSNPRNLPLYRRHGFEAIGRIQVGSSPASIPMVRQAR
jgi:ribosomal protein S18 acetylase RimI-like enzyme